MSNEPSATMSLPVVAMACLLAILAICGLTACGDSRVVDSRETTAFIESPEVSGRDVSVAHALEGSIRSMYRKMSSPSSQGQGPAITDEEYIGSLEQGEWPGADDGWDDSVTGARSIKAWIRLAELAEDWIEKETGEEWVVIDFAYPFPYGMWAEPRTENHHVDTFLLCEEGDYRGVVAEVRYYRWKGEPRYALADDLGELADGLHERERTYTAMRALPEVGGRLVFPDGRPPAQMVVVMESEEDVASGMHPMRAHGAFDEMVSAIASSRGVGTEESLPIQVELVARASAIDLEVIPESTEYPNEKVIGQVPIEEAIRLMLSGHYRPHGSLTVLTEGIAGSSSDSDADGDRGIPTDTMHGMEYDTADEAFKDVGFDMAYPESVDGLSPSTFQSLPSGEPGSDNRILSIEYWDPGSSKMIPHAIIRKERGTHPTRGRLPRNLPSTYDTIHENGISVEIGIDEGATRSQSVFTWVVERDGEPWSYQVIVDRKLSIDEIRALVSGIA